MRTTIGFWKLPFEKNESEQASPRSWSRALCTYARYWISGTGRKPRVPAPWAVPRMVVSSSRVSNTRAWPKRACRSRVTLYTPPFLPTSSPNTSSSGYWSIRSARAELTWAARVRWVGLPVRSGSRPPNSSERRSGSTVTSARARQRGAS